MNYQDPSVQDSLGFSREGCCYRHQNNGWSMSQSYRSRPPACGFIFPAQAPAVATRCSTVVNQIIQILARYFVIFYQFIVIPYYKLPPNRFACLRAGWPRAGCLQGLLRLAYGWLAFRLAYFTLIWLDILSVYFRNSLQCLARYVQILHIAYNICLDKLALWVHILSYVTSSS